MAASGRRGLTGDEPRTRRARLCPIDPRAREAALGVASEQETNDGQGHLDEGRLDKRDNELSLRRGRQHVEPGIDEQKRRGRRRRSLEPG